MEFSKYHHLIILSRDLRNYQWSLKIRDQNICIVFMHQSLVYRVFNPRVRKNTSSRILQSLPKQFPRLQYVDPICNLNRMVCPYGNTKIAPSIDFMILASYRIIFSWNAQKNLIKIWQHQIYLYISSNFIIFAILTLLTCLAWLAD